jgi:hypothetical protein
MENKEWFFSEEFFKDKFSTKGEFVGRLNKIIKR